MLSASPTDSARAQQSLQVLAERINNACARSGRDVSQVQLIGASKTVDAARLQHFFEAGLKAAGENYVQEGVAKIGVLGDSAAQWHFIGALQSNKAREVATHFACVQSVDRVSLARALNRECEIIGRTLDILLQVNLGGEASKAGCAPDELGALFAQCTDFPQLRVRGLMCLPPFRPDAQTMRPDFRQLRALLEKLRDKYASASTCTQLSMGMSNDFEVAIEEGATMIRVGTALFGTRD